MRVAVALHGSDLARVLQTYELLSTHAYTHATPTLYNAGTTSQYLTSCFLYQPPYEGTLSVLGRCVVDLSAFWAVDGGVGTSLGTIPAREYVVYQSLFIVSTDLLPARLACRILRAPYHSSRFSMSTHACML